MHTKIYSMLKNKASRPGYLLRLSFFLAALFPIVFFFSLWAHAAPLRFTDGGGNPVTIAATPRRAVSLVPGVTEIIFRVKADQALKGVTHHTTLPPGVAGKRVVGGFLNPCLSRIEALNPDIIFLSSLHRKVRERFAGRSIALVELRAGSLDDIYRNIRLIGAIFDKKEAAERATADISAQVRLIAHKTARIPPEKKKRVIRLMGREQVMTPGDDSFQNAYIRAAGGIAPDLGKNGQAVPVTLDEWRRFNPQIIYGCGPGRQAARELLSRPGWREVDAMKNGRLIWFPCALTCRASVNAGYFISWLAASIYAKEFSQEENLIRPEQTVGSKPLDLDLEYVKQAQVIETVLSDFIHKTLIVDFKKDLEILSTLEGPRRDVRAVGNHYLPPPGWRLLGQMNLNRLAEKVCSLIDRNNQETSLLFTGANMDNLAVQAAGFRDMTAYALVTAGVKSNAMRMSSDAGNYYEPGTINIIILTNRRLSPRAMARAMITVTEAKTAALQDLDVRSGYSPRVHQATGTGTDNLVIVQGEGPPLDLTGGHTKMGELIARAVYAGVKEAIRRQNGLVPKRSIFQRLEERRQSLYELARRACPNDEPAAGRLTADLEELLLRPRYASFIKTALALEDAWRRGLVLELKGWRDYCSLLAGQAAGRKVDLQAAWAKTETNPGPLDLALQSLSLGLQARPGPE